MQQESRLDGRTGKLSQQLTEYQQSNIRMGEELIALREKINQLEHKQQRLEQQDVQTMPYNQASRLVNMGASLDDLMQACGLSRSEAELMLKLHGNKG
jgi:phage shock protein A